MRLPGWSPACVVIMADQGQASVYACPATKKEHMTCGILVSVTSDRSAARMRGGGILLTSYNVVIVPNWPAATAREPANHFWPGPWSCDVPCPSRSDGETGLPQAASAGRRGASRFAGLGSRLCIALQAPTGAAALPHDYGSRIKLYILDRNRDLGHSSIGEEKRLQRSTLLPALLRESADVITSPK